MFDHGRGYIFQNPDRRIVFALPFAQHSKDSGFTLIGTTDENFAGDLDAVAPSAEEVIYLCKSVSEYFREPVGPQDVVWAFAGVRSLYDDGAGKPEDVTRDYHLTLDEQLRRRAAAHRLRRQDHDLPPARRGGDGAAGAFLPWPRRRGPRRRRCRAAICCGTASRPMLRARSAPGRSSSEGEARRLVRAYGTRLDRVLGGGQGAGTSSAPWFGALSAAEVRYLMANEWAQTADDVLWRRSKLGLRLNRTEKDALAQFMAQWQAGCA